jgi:hypothetical protein
MGFGPNRAYRDDQKHANAGVVTICGGFQVNGASDPTKFNGPDKQQSALLPNGIKSITHSGTGEYTITFLDNFYSCVAVCHGLELATAADKFTQFTGFTNMNSSSNALTCKITTIAGASAADIAANANDGVWFFFQFKKSSSV